MTDPSLAIPLTFAEIDLGALAQNCRLLKQHIGPEVLLMAVVKANAYGHGAVEVARAALANGAGHLAVARFEEGVHLREAGIDAPILVMNYTLLANVDTGIDHDLTLTVTDLPVIERVSHYAGQVGKVAQVHVKIDTGMGRYGLLPDEVVSFFEQAAPYPHIEIQGLFSHFAVSDLADKAYTWQQFEIFERVSDALRAAGFQVPICHIANSAAALDLPAMHLDAVRVGIAMYGLHPSDEVDPAVPVQPVLTLKSTVARVRTLPAGTSISYGRTYITPQAMPVALVPVGYGDGYPRILSNRGAVLINGQRAPIVGRVCMDQFVVDISDCSPVALEDEVVLVGKQQGARISAEEVASWANTINYEITTGLLPRVRRVFV
ncbi:MAG: alanine racemase [Anaerolineae bacterium]|nr:alanine racemase [Anaerolineae bacterium]